MHTQSIERWQHTHVFLGAGHGRNERKIWLVIGLTVAMMVGEIAGGIWSGSLALLADGLHMSTHAGALVIAAVAYILARRHATNPRFAFGTGKFGDLAAFASAIVLAMIALMIGYEAIERLARPAPIAFDEAIAIAILGLVVNLLSAWLLREHEHADHHHDHHGANHDHHRENAGHRDHNLRGAYLHVLADATTSVLAILGLLAGRVYGWLWMDPLVGVVGALVIARWSYGLMRDAGSVLLDVTPDLGLARIIHSRLETGGDRIADLHLWRVGPAHYGAIVSLVSHAPCVPTEYKARLNDLGELAHLTIEVHPCAA